MHKSDVQVGKTYTVKVSGRIVSVRLTAECPLGGWVGVNTETGRKVRIKTAARLRFESWRVGCSAQK